jgi:hypothetical protein
LSSGTILDCDVSFSNEGGTIHDIAKNHQLVLELFFKWEKVSKYDFRTYVD